MQIWNNFLLRLDKIQKENERGDRSKESTDASLGINVAEIKLHLNELAKTNLNGREIRNTISTARQLAMYRKEPLRYHHLEAVIEESKKFDDYLLGLHEDFSPDDIARAYKER